jgi:predicted lipoprotein with Yx(FWY)xxD motif
VLVNAEGLTLYAFTPDSEGVPTCTGDCAGAWPPALVEGEPNYGNLDPSVFSLVEHPDGGMQLKAGDWPLYTFAGDAAPGDTNGQGSNDVWFVVAPDGTLIQ